MEEAMNIDLIEKNIKSYEDWIMDLHAQRSDCRQMIKALTDSLDRAYKKLNELNDELRGAKEVAAVKGKPKDYCRYTTTIANGVATTTAEKGRLSMQWDNGSLTHVWIDGRSVWTLLEDSDDRFEASDSSPEPAEMHPSVVDESKTA